MSANQFGQLKQVDFADNVGGLNLSDSAFKIKENQAAGGVNYDYVLTGGIRKRLGAPKVNAVADTALRSLGLGQYAPTSGTDKYIMRAADRSLQLLDTSTPAFTALTQNTAAASATPFALSSTQQVQFKQFSTGTSDILWGAGGGAALPVGAYSTTKFTANGVQDPSGTFSGAVNAHNSGSWTAAGAYYYAVVYRKSGTAALSNATLDITKTTVNTDDTVTLTLPTIADQTLIDQIWIYRSARNGADGFTTGNLIAQVASNVTSFVDHGDLGNPDVLTAVNVPRENSVILDNSPLPTGTYNTLTLWSNRLVTSSGNSLYISDVNKSESWPTVNYINVPSAGPITALATISFTSPQADSLEELLVIFKETELWVLSPGSSSDYTSWSLLRIDKTGCPQQSLIVQAQGFLAWVNQRGVFLWDGAGKPIYASRLIASVFGLSGGLDKALFSYGCAEYFSRENQIMWFLSSKIYGEQKYVIKMDMSLTLMQVQQGLTGRTLDAVLVQDTYAFPIYSAFAYVPLNGQNEQMLLGDDAGYCYFACNGSSDGGEAFDFRYLTAPLHCGNPNTIKQFHKVIVWALDVGDWDLDLDYWSDFSTAEANVTTIGQPVSTETQTASLWDIATFDTSAFDSYSARITPIVYNLQPGATNASVGSTIQLRFRNDNADQPITIHAFSVIYSEQGGLAG